MDLHERRRHDRYLVWIDAVVRDPSGETRPGVLVELSASGALLQLGEPVAPGTPLALYFKWQDELVTVMCVPVRTLDGPGEMVGVEFTERQREGTWNAIARLLASFAGSRTPNELVEMKTPRGYRQG